MRRVLAVLLWLFLFVGCTVPTAPATGCTLTRGVTDREGRVWLVTAHYAVCPDTS